MAETADRTTQAPDRFGPGTRLAVLGLTMAAAGPLLFALVGLIYGFDTDDLGFFITVGLVALVGAVVVSRPATWAKIVGILVALAVAFTVWWTVFGLFSPASVVDFTGALLVLPGVIIALIGCITALRRRGETTAGPGERRAARVVPAVVGVLALLSLVLTLVSRESVDAPPDATVVTMSDFNFEPEAVTAAGGATVLVRNDDPFVHTFNVDALDIEESLSPGSEVLVTIPAEPGDYVIYCEPHTSDKDDPSEDDMAGRLQVS